MGSSRRLLFVVLIYVSLDLSLPSMPGAFVFDPGDSVESVQTVRARPGIDAIADLPGTGDGGATVTADVRPRREVVPGGMSVRGPSLPRIAPRGDRPRAIANDPPPASADPH